MHTTADDGGEGVFRTFRVRTAIVARQLVLQYQPIVDLRTGGIVAVEALVRWRHPAYGMLPPARFLPAMEHPDDFRVLDSWVLDTASAAISRLDTGAAQPPLLSINVAPQHIGDPQSIVQFAKAIQAGHIDPSRLILELTENAALRDTERAARAIAHLKSLGVRFAIDDFGTGYASMDYLARLPADFLKIDRRFIGRCGDEKHAAIVEAVAQLAERLGIAVVMEGIERPDQLAFARACAPYGQGYLFAPPLDLADLEEMIRTPLRHRIAL